MMDGSITLGLAFFAGVASFLSPCVFAHGVAFVAGFTVIFVLLGVLTGLIGGLLSEITDILVRIGGVIVVIFGLHMTRIIQIPFLNYDLRPQSQPDRNRGYISSAMMGVFFSAGWAPCVGPVLGAILTLSLNGGSITEGASLLTAYSMGLGIPFLLAATQIGWVTAVLRRYNKVMHYAELVMGVVLIIIGVLLFLGRFETLAQFGFFFGATLNEGDVGLTLAFGIGAALLLGLIPAFWARTQEKNFIDYWFLGSGVSMAGLILLYFVGVLDPLITLLL
jgi:cytochrome c-type biogenesis protein